MLRQHSKHHSSFRYIDTVGFQIPRLNSASRTRTRGRVVLGEPGDPDGRGWQDFALRPGEHLASMFCGYPGFVRWYVHRLLFDTTAGRSTPLHDASTTTRRAERSIEAPPGSAIRNFYGRVKKHRIGTWHISRCAASASSSARRPPPSGARAHLCVSQTPPRPARAVIDLADGDGPLGRLPEVLVHLVLAFAIDLLPR